jgi:DNA-binding response OmpR family regulator
VEDNAADVFLIRKAIDPSAVCADLHVVHDGQSAMQFFDAADADASAPCPDLVLLDLNLPRKNGDEILKHLRRSSRCRRAPVLVMTSSDSARDRELLVEFGVSDYFRKPSDFAGFMKLGDVVERTLG